MSGKAALKPESILPENPDHWLALRAKDITSTESPALFGLSPYTTEFELFYRKKDAQIVSIEQNTRMKWGTRLQDSIAKGIAEDEGWQIRRMDEYMRDPDLRMGSSFDYEITPDGILEVKNVGGLAFKEGWIVDGENVEAPPHIEIQVQHQLAVSGRAKAYIGALVDGNRVVLIERTPDLKIIDELRNRIQTFWVNLKRGIAPKPDFSRDADFISKLYRYSAPGKIISAENNPVLTRLAAKHKELGVLAQDATDQRDAIKAELLMMIGGAEKVLGDGFSISAATVPGARVAFDRQPYRGFRINWKKEKI